MESTNSMQPGTFLGPTKLLDRAWMIFEKKWKTMLIVTLPVIMLAILFFAVIGVFIGVGVFMGTRGTFSPWSIGIAGLVVLAIAYLVLIVASLWMQLAQLFVVVNHEREVSFQEAYGATAKYILSLLWVGILTALVVACGFMVLVIPGIIFAGWFTFVQIVLVDQNVRGLNALLTSREYVRGRWFGVVGRMLAFVLVYIVLILLFGAVDEALRRAGLNLLASLVSIASSVVQVALSFLMITYLYAMYENLKMLKPGAIPIASSTRTKFTVLALVGLLAFGSMMSIPILLIAANPAGVIQSARDANRLLDIGRTKTALQVYHSSYDSYPASLDELVKAGFLASVPTDPLTKDQYVYQAVNGGKDFKLCTHFENLAGNKKTGRDIVVGENGDYCISDRDLNPDRMVPPQENMMNQDQNASESGEKVESTGPGRMMRPQGYSPNPNVEENDLPNRY